MKVLAIDTSNFTLGIALIDGNQVMGEYITNLKKNHSVRVMPAIETLLKDCDTLPKELDKIVVAKGPGSYTGSSYWCDDCQNFSLDIEYTTIRGF